MKRILLFAAIFSFLLVGCDPPKDKPQGGPGTPNTPTPTAKGAISDFEVKAGDDPYHGELVVTIDGEKKTVADDAMQAWLSEDKKTIYYSFHHGESGFEAEGQGVKRYQADSGLSDLIFKDDFEITKVEETRSASGKPVLLVHMTSGGLGGPNITIADPDKGRVFSQELSDTVGPVKDGKVTIGEFTEDDVENPNAKPKNTRVYDLDELLKKKADRNVQHPWPPAETQ